MNQDHVIAIMVSVKMVLGHAANIKLTSLLLFLGKSATSIGNYLYFYVAWEVAIWREDCKIILLLAKTLRYEVASLSADW